MTPRKESIYAGSVAKLPGMHQSESFRIRLKEIALLLLSDAPSAMLEALCMWETDALETRSKSTTLFAILMSGRIEDLSLPAVASNGRSTSDPDLLPNRPTYCQVQCV